MAHRDVREALREERERILARLAALEVSDGEAGEREGLLRRLEEVRRSLEQASPPDRSTRLTLPHARACVVPWEAMVGSHRTRQCSACGADVHDVTALTEDELAALIASAGPGLRVRPDGRLQRGGCPRSWRGVAGVAVMVAAAVALGSLLVALDHNRGPSRSPDEPRLVLRERWVHRAGTFNLQVSAEVRSSDRTLARGEVEPLLRLSPPELVACTERAPAARMVVELTVRRGHVEPHRTSCEGGDRASAACVARFLARHAARNAPPRRSLGVRFLLESGEVELGAVVRARRPDVATRHGLERRGLGLMLPTGLREPAEPTGWLW